jgi:flavin reductase (DIM6/NTAB) family NADH-FMN oxidoreductase RutF
MNKSSNFAPERFREAMRAWSSGVTIVTANYRGERHGMTVSSFTSIAIEPPVVIISLQMNSRTHELVTRAGAFGVTILTIDQQSLAERFAGRFNESEDRFKGVDTESLVTGAPLIRDGLVGIDCQVRQVYSTGSNTLFLGEVVAVTEGTPGQPLVYHDRNYRKLED